MKLRLTENVLIHTPDGWTSSEYHLRKGTIIDVEEIKDERDWEPLDQETFYFIGREGKVDWAYYEKGFEGHELMRLFGNFFLTKEEAEPYAQKMREVFKRK